MQLPRVPDRPTVAVIGGSTPFLCDLFAALVHSSAAARPADLRLIGRNERALQIMAAHAGALLVPLGWQVTATTAVDAGVDGADIVIHQARYGDFAGRAADEQVAQSVGIPGDETLGPGGLRAAVRIRTDVERMAGLLRRGCPDAIVVNLTNPLSVTTQLFAAAGVGQVFGVCELPELTATQLGSILQPGGELAWSYTGLNHRGFIHGLGEGIDELVATSGQALSGVLASDLAELRAVPLKYFGLASGRYEGQPVGQSGRAMFLQALRTSALDELAARPGVRPAMLDQRPQPWYACSVVPVLATLRTGSGSHVLNLADDGVVREVRVVVTDGRVERLVDEPPAELRHTLGVFEEHERRVLAAATDPTIDNLIAACAADPMVASDATKAVAQRVLASLPAADGG